MNDIQRLAAKFAKMDQEKRTKVQNDLNIQYELAHRLDIGYECQHWLGEHGLLDSPFSIKEGEAVFNKQVEEWLENTFSPGRYSYVDFCIFTKCEKDHLLVKMVWSDPTTHNLDWMI